MATGTAPPQPSSPPPVAAVGASERVIDEHLDRTRRHIFWLDIGTGVVVWLAALAGFLFGAALWDHWIAPLSTFGRWLALLAMAAMTGFAWWRWIVPPLLRKVNPAYAARMIEERGERLNNSLLNYLFLRRERAAVPEAVFQSVQRRAAGDLERVSWDAVMDYTPTFRWAYVLAGLLAILAAYKILSPKDPLRTAARVLAPWAQLARPSRVELRDVLPGDAKVYHGKPLEVSVDLRGLRAGEEAVVLFSTADGQTVNQRVPLNVSTDGLRYEAIVPPGRDGVRQDLTYRIEAGDAASRDYRVEVLPAPTIVVDRVELEPPRYTQLPRATLEHQGDVRGVEGTKVTIQARASLPIKSAYVGFDPLAKGDAETQRARILPMQVDPDGLHARQSFFLQLKPDRTGPLYETYQVRFVTPEGVQSEAPITHSLSVQADLAPEVEFLAPRQAEVTLRIDRRLPLEVRAIDPDFGLAKLTLRGERTGALVLDQRLVDDPAGAPGQVIAKYDLSPRKLQLEVGDELTLWAEVEDNRADWKTGRPAPNTQRTSSIRVRIVAADAERAADDTSKPDTPTSESNRPEEQEKPTTGDDGGRTKPDGTKPDSSKPDNSKPVGSKPDQAKPKDSSGSDDQPASKSDSSKPDPSQQPKDKSSGGGEKSSAGEKPGAGEKPSDKPSDKPGSKPGDSASEKPGTQPGEKPGDTAGDMSAEKPGSKPGDSGAGKPGDKPMSKPGQPESKGAGSKGNSSEQPGDPAAEKPNEKPGSSPNQQPGESQAPKGKQGKQQPGDPQQPRGTPEGKEGSQEKGKGTGGASGGESSAKPEDPPAGAEGSDSGASSGNSNGPNGPQPNGGQNSSNQPGRTTGRPGGNDASGKPSDGEPTGELHDGDVIQRALEHLKNKQGNNGKPTGKPAGENSKPGDAPAGKPEGSAGSKPDGAAGQKPEGTGAGETPKPDDIPPPNGNAKPGTGAKPGTPAGSKPAGDGNSTGDAASKDTGTGTSGKPTGGAETKPETKPGESSRPKEKSPGAGTGENGESGAGQGTEKPEGGSPSPITKPQDRPKTQKPDDKQSGSGEPSTPSESMKQSDSKGGEGGDRSGGGRQGGGQGAKQAGNDSAGSSSPGDEGNGAAPEAGRGPDGTKGGAGKPASKPTGSPSGDQRGPGSTSTPGKGESPKPDGGKPSTPPRSKPDGANAADGGTPGAPGAADGSPNGPVTGGGKAGGAPGGAPTPAGEVPEGSDANLDYARKSTDLVLEYLKDQKENPDPELLDKLGWTQDDLRKFLDRWQQLKDAADKQDPSARRELDESLKSLGLRPGKSTSRAAQAGADQVRGNRDDGQRSRPPSKYAEQFKAYRKGTSSTEVQGK